MLEKICRRYKKLPTEILEQDYEWIDMVSKMIILESKRKEIEYKRAKQKSKV